MKRILDIVIIALTFWLLAPLIFLICCFIMFFSGNPILHWSKRVGKNGKIFLMPKFRTMRLDTPQLATHLLTNPQNYLIFGGSLLRKLSLDELPQIYSVIRGEMSLVGPRPALFNQDDLILLRKSKKVDTLLPGVTGWAQINGRDELGIEEKVLLEEEYLKKQSILFDMLIIFRTLYDALRRKNIKH